MKTLLKFKGLIILLLMPISIIGQEKEMPKYFCNAQGVAIDGYDLVNYFTDKNAEKGDAKFAVTHDGTTFYFKNSRNKNKFTSNPKKYLPEYNGYCAFGLGQAGKKFPVDPKTFKIENEKLYLFFNGPIRGKVTNTLTLWNQNETALKSNADKAWKELNNETPKEVSRKELALSYFEAFHMGNLKKVHTLVSEDCSIKYGNDKAVAGKVFFPKTKDLISTLEFQIHDVYAIDDINNDVIVSFSYHPKADSSKVTKALDVISFDENDKISNILVIPALD